MGRGAPPALRWALLASAVVWGVGENPPPLHVESPPHCAPEDTIRACILSDRAEQLLAVIRSAHASAEPTTCIDWDIFTTDADVIETIMSHDPIDGVPSRHSIRVSTLLDAEMALEEKGITPVWLRPGFEKGASGHPRRTAWSLREPVADSDPKHAHPLNLLRFYLPELPEMQHARVLLFDDDVCVQRDLRDLYLASPDHTMAPSEEAHAPVLLASCQMQQYEPERGGFRIRLAQYTYADTPFLGTVGGPAGYPLCPTEEDSEEEDGEQDCDPAEGAKLARRTCAPAALEPKLVQLHSEINGRATFRNQTAWNFGVSLVHLSRWRSSGISRRFDRWFTANEHFAFFAPTSVSFGLGLAYLALAGNVECWPERTVLDGLGFLTWDDLQSSGITEAYMQDTAVLHFAGARKPSSSQQAVCAVDEVMLRMKKAQDKVPKGGSRRLSEAEGYAPASVDQPPPLPPFPPPSPPSLPPPPPSPEPSPPTYLPAY